MGTLPDIKGQIDTDKVSLNIAKGRKGEAQIKSNTHHFDMNETHKKLIRYAREWENTRQ